MNYNIIAQLLENGISEEEILSSITKSLPSIAKKASKLFSGGWRAKDVLDYFSRDKDVQKTLRKGVKPTTPGEIAAMRLRDSYTNIAPNEKEQSIEELKSFTKKAAPLALGAIGSLASPMAQNALQRALPQVSGLLQNAMGNGNPILKELQKSESNIQQQQINPSQPPVSQNNIPQAANPVPPEVKSIDIGKILKSSVLLPHIEKEVKKGRKPREIAAILYQSHPKEMKELQKQTGKNMEDAISDFLGQNQAVDSNIAPEIAQNQPKINVSQPEIEKIDQSVPDLGEMGKGITENLYKGLFESLKKGSTKFAGIEDPFLKKVKIHFDRGEIKSPEDLKNFANKQSEEPAKIEKKSLVATPKGMGEVKEIRNGKALIDVDGKKEVVNEEELISSPLPEKDLAELYQELIGGIEKTTGKQVSRNVEWAGYDPKTNELVYKPHQSDKVYVYDEISPEDVEVLTNFLTQRKTTGENFIGPWEAGTKSPIGAAMDQLIKKLQSQRGGKGNEYKNRFETIYDALEPSKLALKELYKKRKKKK